MKGKFWRILAVVFILWLFLLLWINRFQVKYDHLTVMKFNRFTGQAYSVYTEANEKWKRAGE